MAKHNGNGARRRRKVEHGYPRPQLFRNNWMSLNGAWDFAIDPEGRWTEPQQADWSGKITVPFAPETPASGVHRTDFFQACWYRRMVQTPSLQPGQRIILHLGAVDWEATVWVNGRLVAHHEGGYTPFSADITDTLIESDSNQEIVICAHDDPHDLEKPRGKQDWCRDAHSIWYWRTSGIWQTVWFEVVPQTWIRSLQWIPNVQRWELELTASTDGHRRDDLRLRVQLHHKGRVIVDDSYALQRGSVQRRIALPDPGIEDYRADLLWSPSHPNLIRAEIDLLDSAGEVLDRVESYAAMRSAAIHGDRVVLNGRPYYLRLVLDQGYWADSGLTPPDDESLRRDIELTLAMGFNGVRKHQKIEDPRYLYWADVLGLLVWEEMPSPYAFSRRSIARLTQTWAEAIERDLSHPCIIAWVPFNESWGVPDLPDVAAHREFVKGVYHLTRALDPTRPVIGNDGWESVATDIIAIHDYDADPDRLRRRYDIGAESIADMLRTERPGGRALVIDEPGHIGLPMMLTEFGGIAFSKQRGTWGYSTARTPDDFAARYAALLEAVRSLPRMTGFCYTQLTDTYQEANGLLYMDRTPKFPVEQVAIATRGAQSDADRKVQAKWRQRMMAMQRTQEAAR